MKQEKANNEPCYKTRIAPTPSGYLHLGNAFSFILTCLIRSKYDAELLLRIDDLDSSRIRSIYLEDVFHTLEWLGIQPDSGPSSVGEHLSTYSQQLRLDLYETEIGNLLEGSNAFFCNCSRKQVKSGMACFCVQKGLSLDSERVALKVKTGKTDINVPDVLCSTQINLAVEMPDFILKRKDGIPAYQIASLVDDLHFGVNLIVRGKDLLSSTAGQLYLASLLGKTAFLEAKFYHHPLVLANRNKLSKSQDSTDLRVLRKEGNSSRIYQWVSEQLKIEKGEKIKSLEDLTEAFLEKDYLKKLENDITFNNL